MGEKIIVITDPERDRYASSRLISWWDQRLLSEAQVMVVGAGALGNELLKNLALLGVGRLFVVDFDRIDLSNLSRSVLFRAEDAGGPKAEVAAERVRALNPDVRVRAFAGDVIHGVGLGVFRRMNAVLGCLDNREARWAVNRACHRAGRPWIDGGLNALDGNVKLFVPPDGACYECGLTEQDRRVMTVRYSCPGITRRNVLLGRIPTTITSAAIIAGLQVQELMKLLHGQPVAPGTAFVHSGLGAQTRTMELARRKGCAAHRVFEPVVELDAGADTLTLGGLLRAARERLGEGAHVRLDRQLIVRLSCRDCGAVEEVMRVFEGAWPEVLACPACGATRLPELTHVIDDRTPSLHRRLAEAGVPPLHILEARSGERRAYLELTADAAETLAYE